MHRAGRQWWRGSTVALVASVWLTLLAVGAGLSSSAAADPPGELSASSDEGSRPGERARRSPLDLLFPPQPTPDFPRNRSFRAGEEGARYYVWVPSTYDVRHREPMPLLVWMHGCGGRSEQHIARVAPEPDDRYLVIAPAERENACWRPRRDHVAVLAAITDMRKHFAVDTSRVVLGGGSSGGSLAYRMAYDFSPYVDGVLAANTAPFSRTGRRAASSLERAGTTFRIVHLAHRQDELFPFAKVRKEIRQLREADFPVRFIVRKGTHYDPDRPSKRSGTYYDIRRFLLPHVIRR